MQNVAERPAGTVDEEVVSMSSSPVCGRRLTVILVPQVEDDLHLLERRTNLSSTDLTNRAITMYEFIDGRARDGYDMFTRDKRTGRTELVEFLGVGRGPDDADAPHLFQAGHPARPGRHGRHRIDRRVHQRLGSGHDRPHNEMGRLRRQLLNSKQLLHTLVVWISAAARPAQAA
jgi:hypothetical protein